MVMAKNKKINKVKRSEVLYYRMLIVLTALIAVIFSLTYFTNTVEKYNNFTLNTAPITAMVFAGLSVLALVYFVVQRLRGADEQHRVLSSGFLTAVMIWVASIFGLFNRINEKKLIAYVVVSAALYFIYYLYKREFFAFSLFTALGAFLLAAMSSASRAEHIILSALVVILCVGYMIILICGKKRTVEFKLGKSRYVLADSSFRIYPFCISAGLMIAGTVISFMLPTTFFYSSVVLFGYYLVITVISTVQMM